MRVLALDLGEKRTGVAVSDATGRIAMPLKVLPTNEVLQKAPSWRRILEDYEPDLLVVGEPRTLAGEHGAQAERLREMAESVAAAAAVDLAFADERLTSREAKRILRDQGLSEREMRGSVDRVAASLMLQSYLDSHPQTQ